MTGGITFRSFLETWCLVDRVLHDDVRCEESSEKLVAGLGSYEMRRKTVASVAFLLILGLALLGLSSAHLKTSPHLTQISLEDNPGNPYTVFLEQGLEYQIDLTVDAAEVGRSYNITVIQVDQMRVLFGMGGPIEGQVIPVMFPAGDTGHYEIDWNGLNVTEAVVYRVDDFGNELIPSFPVSVAGVSAVTAGIACFYVFERDGLFFGRKTRLFWYGLIIFGFTFSWLFGVLWFSFVLEPSLYGDAGPQLFGGLVFLFIGSYMMKNGVKKEKQAL